MENIPVVILCGGKGFRLREFTETMPKALVPIGNMPILLHVMKLYAHHGYRRFILSLGYKGNEIKQYFMNHDWMSNDFLLKMGPAKEVRHLSNNLHDFEITFVDTGLETNTGGRVKKIEKHIDTENFMATYCDGVANIDLNSLFGFHKNMGRIATLTGVHPITSFGFIETENGIAKSFREKPTLPGLVNGGFFVFNKKIFEFLEEDSILEDKPLRTLASAGQLAVYEHKDFWACMDTFKDVERLNGIWETGYMPLGYYQFKKAPWKIWE